MHKMFQKMEDQIINSWRLLDRAMKDDEVLSDFSCYGYDENKLNDGQDLYNKTVTAIENKDKAIRVYMQACVDAEEKLKQAYHVYMVYLRLIKRFNGSEHIDDKKPVPPDDPANGCNWVESARLFYSDILTDPEAIDFLSKRRLSIDKMKEGLKTLDDFEASLNRRQAARNKVLMATLERNALLEQLLNWTSNIIDVSSRIFKSNPDILDRLSGCCRGYNISAPAAG